MVVDSRNENTALLFGRPPFLNDFAFALIALMAASKDSDVYFISHSFRLYHRLRRAPSAPSLYVTVIVLVSSR